MDVYSVAFLFVTHILFFFFGMACVVHVNGRAYRETGDCSCANPNK